MSPRSRLFRLPFRNRKRITEDVNAEFAFHIEMRVTELTARGMTAAEARAEAVRELGDLKGARSYIESVDRDIETSQRRRAFFADGMQDLSHALRRLRSHPTFSATIVLTLALGIAACTLMFSLVSGILLTPLPYGEPDRLTMIWGHVPQIDLGFPEQPVHGRHFTVMRDNMHAFQSLTAFRPRLFNLGDVTQPQRLDGVEATGEFFETMGVHPALGRFFTRAEEAPGADHVAVLSHDLWRLRFAGDSSVIGRSITLNGEPYIVAGVAPPGFAFPRGPEMPGDFQFPARAEIWAPMKPATRGPSDLAIAGRMAKGATLLAAPQDMDRITGLMEEQIPAGKGWFNRQVVALGRQVAGDVGTMLWSLLAAVGLVLAITCANAAQLLVARLQAGRQEMAVRAALGASGRRLASGPIIEVLVLAGLAGAAGTALGIAGIQVLRTYGSEKLPRLAEIGFDWRSAMVAVAVTLITGLLAGVAPAIAATRIPVIETLRGGGRGAGKALSAGWRRSLIVVEVALSVVLVASAALLIRSLSKQLSSATGFSASDGVTFELTLPPLKYPEQQGRTFMEHPAAVAFIGQVLDRIRALPGVEAAAIGKPLPLSGAQEATVFAAEGINPPAGDSKPFIAEFTVASPEMFKALGTPMIAGRDFGAMDTEDGAQVVIVNASMAKWLWPGQDPLGKRIRVGGSVQPPAPWMTVVGVAADMKRYSLTQTPRPEMTVPYTQRPYPTFSAMQFVIRSPLPAATLMPSVQRAIAEVDPTIPVASVRSIDELVRATSANARFAVQAMTAFGAASVLLAMIGLYGVVAYSVHLRRREFGIRRALGAASSEILRLVLNDGLRIMAAGLAIGVALAALAAALIRHLLYEVSPIDGAAFAGSIVLLAAAAVLACVIPAKRATRVEPRVALEDGG